MPLTVGTAGHIDHGKTWLVRALTGKDTDRLPEEQRRGISIDLGYAPLELADGQHLSVVDVPGHERFVRTMVAGATGIDLFLLVIDAAEGARPQTLEHLAIVRLLGIEHGVVAITKVDAVDGETRALAVEEARELVPGVPIVQTSARTGEGLDELRRALATAASLVERRRGLSATRLFVDRSFTLRGIGTVVTGTLWSGTVGEGDELLVEPAGLEVRVRSAQVHDRPVERAEAGQRVAVSLPGLERSRIRRGDVLVEPGAYPCSYRLDISLEELETIPERARVHVHHGTSVHTARLLRVGERYAQLRLATPAVAARGDRVVLRERTTIGGGAVLDPAPPRRPSVERLTLLEQGDPGSIVAAVLGGAPQPLTRQELAGRALLAPALLDEGLTAAVRAGDYYLTGEHLERLREEVAATLAERAARVPLDPGVPIAELLPRRPWAASVLPLLPLERRGAKAYAPGASASLGDREAAASTLEAQLREAGLSPVKTDDAGLAAFLEGEGRLVRLPDGHVLGVDAFAEARRLVVEECEAAGSITLARFRDLAATNRKAAQLVLERLDTDGVTRRAGDARVLRRRGRQSA
jgi:selenocysteine-specific elongation factor